MPLWMIFDRLSKTHNVVFKCDNQEILDQIYRATFDNESLTEILNIIGRTSGIHFKYHKRILNENGSFESQIIEVK